MELIKLFVYHNEEKREDVFYFDHKEAGLYLQKNLMGKNQIDVINLFKRLFEEQKFTEGLLVHTLLKYNKVSNWFYGDLLSDRRLTKRIEKWIGTFPQSGILDK